VQVDEAGNTTSIFTQERLFRNLPSIRYVGKIHEQLSLHVDNIVYGDDIAVIHTGYSLTSYAETNKAQRNIDILKIAISEDPENINLKGYLADALIVNAQMDGSIEDALPEINKLYKEVINTDSSVLPQSKKIAYMHFIELYIKDIEKYSEYEEMCAKALEDFPDDSDILYYSAVNLNNKGDYQAALDVLRRCEDKMVKNETLDITKTVTANPALLQEQIAIAERGIADCESLQ
jgi:tetratricopeptide (TPR) repeat protein